MSPHSSASGPVRPVDVVNAQIRAIVVGARGRSWTWAEQALYQLLLEEYAVAVRADITEAA